MPTRYAWCSYQSIGQEREIPPGCNFWSEILTHVGSIDFFPHRSVDGLTVFIIPVLTEIKWCGRC